MTREIYLALEKMIHPDHTALVIWDVQKVLFKNIFNKDEFAASLKSLLGAARENHVPVVYTKILRAPAEWENPARLRFAMNRYKIFDAAKVPQVGDPADPEMEIAEEVKPGPADLVLSKHTANIFVGTPFDYFMRNRGIETLIFTGIATDMGIDTSARNAASLGYYTVVVSDCVSSSDKGRHEAIIKTLPVVCPVLTAEEIKRKWPIVK